MSNVSLQQFFWAADAMASGSSEQTRTAAEQIVLTLKKSPEVLQFCHAVLSSSSSNSNALFYTFLTLKEALVAQWTALTTVEIHAWLEELLQFMYTKHDDLPIFVIQQFSSTISIIAKRSSVTGDPWARSKVLETIFALLHSNQHSFCILALVMSDSLVTEFGVISSGLFQVPSQQQRTCKIEFQAQELPRIFTALIQTLKRELVCETSNASQGKHVLEIVSRSTELLEKIMGWNFSSLQINRSFIMELKEFFRPSAEWKETVLNSNAFDIITEVGFKFCSNEKILNSWLHCMGLLASLNGPIFTDKCERAEYLQKFVTFFNHRLAKITDVYSNQPFEVASLAHKLCCHFDKVCWESLPQQTFLSFFRSLCELTVQFCQSLCNEEFLDDDHVFRDAYQLLLNCWVIHITHNEFLTRGSPLNDLCVAVFSNYVQCHISAPEGFRQDSQDSEIDENEESDRILFVDQLDSIATVARSCLDKCLPLLTSLMEVSVTKLQNCLANKLPNVESVFEDIHWVVLISSHVIGDELEGETLTIPFEVLELSLSVSDVCTRDATSLHNVFTDYAIAERENFDPLIKLVASMLQYVNMENRFLHAEMSILLSPEVSCDVLLFLKRLSECYILHQPQSLSIEISASLRIVFGEESGGGQWLIDNFLCKILLNILKYNSEHAVILDSLDLLLTLVKNHQSAVLKCPAMNEIIQLITNHDRFWCSLSMDCCQILMQSFMMAVNKNPEMGKALLKTLLQDTFDSCVKELNQKKQNHKCGQSLDLRDFGLVIELLRGAVKASDIENSKLILEHVQNILYNIPSIISSNFYNDQILTSILRLFSDLLANTVTFLDQKQMKIILGVVLSILQITVSHNLVKISLSLKSLELESVSSRMELVLSLLASMSSINSADMFNTFDSEDISSNTLSGLNIIVPCLTEEVLMIPQVSEKYYYLISSVFELCSEKIITLNQNVYHFIFSSLESALKVGNADQSNSSLTCISYFARSAAILRNQSSTSQSESVDLVVNTCRHFMRVLFECLLNHSIASENSAASSDAMFNLINLLPEEVNEIFSAIMSKMTSPNDVTREKVVHAFSALTSPMCNNDKRGGGTGSRNVRNTNSVIFKNRMENFLDVVSGLILI